MSRRSLSGGVLMRPDTHSGRRRHGHSVWPKRGQAGVGLMEVLVAIILMGVVAGGIVGMTLTTLHVGAQARSVARLNTLTTSFGEALKALPYRECASAAEYRSAFEAADAAAREPHLRDAPGATFRVRSVAGGDSSQPSCPDQGTQVVSFDVEVAGRSQKASVLKRSSDSPQSALTPDFTWNIKVPGAPELLIELVPIVRRGTEMVDTTGFTFEWWCMPAWDGSPPAETPPRADDDLVPIHYQRMFQDPEDPVVGLAECRHAAPRENTDDPDSIGVGLLVTDNRGILLPVTWKKVPLPVTTVNLDPPGASIRVRNSPPAPACTLAPGDQCGRDQVVELDGIYSTPGAGTFGLCSWTFEDGWPPQVFRGSDCHEQPVARTYFAPTTVHFTVSNSYGYQSEATYRINVPGSLSPPTAHLEARFADYVASSGTVNDSLRSYAPERIQFSGTFGAGNADAGGVITKYVLDFGDGTTPVVVGGTSGSEPALSSVAGVSHRFVVPTAGLTACQGRPGALATLTVTERVWDVVGDQWVYIPMAATVCVRLEDLESQQGPVNYVNRRNEYFNAGLTGDSRVWLGFQWSSILDDPNYPANGFLIEQRYTDVTFTSTCAIKTMSRVDFPREDNPINPGDQRRERPSITSGFGGDAYRFIVSEGDGCRHQARLIRVTKDVDSGPASLQCPDPPAAAVQLKNQLGATLIQCSSWSIPRGFGGSENWVQVNR